MSVSVRGSKSVESATPRYERERPELFGASLQESGRVFDPEGVRNPGVLEPAE